MKIIITILFVTVTLLSITSCTKEIETKTLQQRAGLVYEANKKDAFSGKAITYYSKDKVQSETSYENGRRDGLKEAWYENGQQKIKESYNEGKLDGESKHWHENGQAKETAWYKQGRLHGTKTEWDKEAFVTYKAEYKDGQRID